MDLRRPFLSAAIAVVAIAAVSAGCGSAATTSSSADGQGSPAPTTSVDPGAAMSIEAPDQVAAGAEFEVSWTGETGSGDYLVVVPKGASTAADAPYVNMSVGAPVALTAPAEPGEYEVWWVEGDTVDDVHARRAITVT